MWPRAAAKTPGTAKKNFKLENKKLVKSGTAKVDDEAKPEKPVIVVQEGS